MASGGVVMDGLFVLHVDGTLTTGTKRRVQIPFPIEVVSVRAAVGTAPTGAALLLDVNKDGTTIFTTQANRPTIAISGTETAAGGATPDAQADYAAEQTLSLDIDQIGSSVAGADLTVTIAYRYDTD